MDIGLYDYNARYYAPTLARFLSPDTLIPDPANPQAFNRYSYVENRPLNFNDPTGHCANEFFDTDCWDEYDALVNQFKANDYTEEQILDLIGTGEDYVYKGMRTIDIFDRYRNCGSDFDCSNKSPSMCYDGNGSYPCNQHNRYRPCQYWQPCYQDEHFTIYREGRVLFYTPESVQGHGPKVETPDFICVGVCIAARIHPESSNGETSLEVMQVGLGSGAGVSLGDFSLDAAVIITVYSAKDDLGNKTNGYALTVSFDLVFLGYQRTSAYRR